MKHLKIVMPFLLSILVLATTVIAYGDGKEPHDNEKRDMSSMGAGRMEMKADDQADFIRYASLTGHDIVLGRKNPVKVLEHEVITDDQGRKVKVFNLTVDDVKFEIYPGKELAGWGFNKTIPGPTIRVTEGDRIRINMTNKTKDEHTLHIHGQKKPLNMDGVPYLGQNPVKKDETYAYEFTVMNPGTHWYHCHVDGGHHVDMGMYGAFIVDPKKKKLKYDREYTLILDEWPSGHQHLHGGAMPMEEHEGDEHGVVTEHMGTPRHDDKTMDDMSKNKMPMKEIKQAGGMAMPQGQQIVGMEMKAPQRDWYPKTYNAYKPVYDTYTINGRSFPYTEPLTVKKGEKVLIRIINAGYQEHYMHSHTHKFLVVARDGNPVKNPQLLDTVDVGPGKRADILLTADNPGVWPFHCHNLLHVANDHIYPGGMLTFIRYVE